MAGRQRLRVRIGGREATATRGFRIALASAVLLAITACAAMRQQIAALTDLTNALSHQFGQQFTINLNVTSGVLAIAATMAPDDTVKVSRSACADRAAEVARFAATHYADSNSVSYIDVKFVLQSDYGALHISRTYCEGGGRRDEMPTRSPKPTAPSPAT
jgi:hypothetical protein